MKKCVFCDIASKKIDETRRIILFGDDYIAMKVLNPKSVGHFIVFPKKHVSEMRDMKSRGHFFEEVVRIAEEEIVSLKASAYVLKLNNNLYKIEDDPRHVGHLHMHVIPKYKE